uniref:RNA-binding protein 7-like n=1 Tax=Hirondellea gigas TaxID=1518452 RepID=A0A2P2IAW5_9CRUS
MGDEQERTMYVGNLHDDVTEPILYELFLQAGPLQRISRPKDRDSGKLKNFAFVVFAHAVSIPYAIHLTNGIKLFGRALKTQQRNNMGLPHYSTVGVQNIECETQVERCLNGLLTEDEVNQGHQDNNGNESYNKKKRSNSYGKKGAFTPKPLDPNQTWKNNIDYQHDQRQQGHLVSNAMMGGSLSGMSASGYNSGRRDRNSSSSHSSFSTSPASRSAGHYHQLNSEVLSQMGGSGGAGISSDMRSRLGSAGGGGMNAQTPVGQGSSYRSTRDNYGSSYNNSGGYNDGNHSSGGRSGGYNHSTNSSGYYSNDSTNDGSYNSNSRHGGGSNRNRNNNRYYDRDQSGGYGNGGYKR